MYVRISLHNIDAIKSSESVELSVHQAEALYQVLVTHMERLHKLHPCDWQTRRAKGDSFVMEYCGRETTNLESGHPRCSRHRRER